MKLTQGYVNAAKYAESGTAHDLRQDDEIPGLALRVYPSGEKSYMLTYHLRGRRRRIVIGKHPVMMLAQARRRAIEILSSVIRGQDPKPETDVTLEKLCEMYLKRHARAKKSSFRQDENRIDLYLRPHLGSLILGDISRVRVGILHSQIGETAPIQANRVLALISKIWECGRAWGFIEESAPNPCRGIEKFPEATREIYVSRDKMPALISAIEQDHDPWVRAAIWLFLLTGLRKTELLSLRWSQIQRDPPEIILPHPKQKNPHRVPLVATALMILDGLPREVGPWVFPGKGKGHLVDLKRPWARIRAACEMPDLRLHDLRRTVGTWLAQQNVSLHIIGSVLGHKQSSTTEIYARLSTDERRAALEVQEKSVLGVVKKMTNDIGKKNQ